MKDLKRFLVKLFAFLLPLVLALSVFLYFEPYDYFGLHKDGRNETKAITRLRRFLYSKETNNIIIGDSRAANVDLDVLEELSGKKWTNVSFGGARVREMIDVFWFCVEEKPVETVYFQLSFHTMNKNHSADRVRDLWETLLHFDYYLWNRSVRELTYDAFIEAVLNDGAVSVNEDTRTQEEKLSAHTDIIYGICMNYELDTECIAEIIEIAQYCYANNIELVFFTPPMYKIIWERVIAPLDLYDEIDSYKATLSQYAVLYDMELEDSPISNMLEAFPLDGLHFNGNAEEVFYASIWGGQQSASVRIWYPPAGKE